MKHQHQHGMHTWMAQASDRCATNVGWKRRLNKWCRMIRLLLDSTYYNCTNVLTYYVVHRTYLLSSRCLSKPRTRGLHGGARHRVFLQAAASVWGSAQVFDDAIHIPPPRSAAAQMFPPADQIWGHLSEVWWSPTTVAHVRSYYYLTYPENPEEQTRGRV